LISNSVSISLAVDSVMIGLLVSSMKRLS
jgi:hypothetical protein